MFKKILLLLAATLFSFPSRSDNIPNEAQWEKNADANRAAVQNLFTPSWKRLFENKDNRENDFDEQLQNASLAWLEAIVHFAKYPDARLFLLADPTNFGNEEIAQTAIRNVYSEDMKENYFQFNDYQFYELINKTIVKIDLSPDMNHGWGLTYIAIPQADHSIIGILQSSGSDRYS